MAYYSGQAASYQELIDALVSACQSNGYSYQDNILFKNDIFLRIQVSANNIDFWGRTSLTSADTPNAVRIGKFGENTIQPTIVFPAQYEIFIDTNEVYLIFKYSVNYYQWLAFGKTSSPVDGTGMYLSASVDNKYYTGWNGISIFNSGGGNNFEVCPAFAFSMYSTDGDYNANNLFINSALDGDGWKPANETGATIGVSYLSELLSVSPSAWSNDSILFPLQVFKPRPSSKISLILELKNARHIRIDNLEPEAIITLGQDRWKVFPWYCKNTTQRNGGNGLKHTGTFGWAIRYDGP